MPAKEKSMIDKLVSNKSKLNFLKTLGSKKESLRFDYNEKPSQSKQPVSGVYNNFSKMIGNNKKDPLKPNLKLYNTINHEDSD